MTRGNEVKGSSSRPLTPICPAMGRSLIGFCAFLGSTFGSFAPELWGASSFSIASVVFAFIGGVAGIWFGARLTESWL